MNMENIIKTALIGLAAFGLASCGDSFFEQYPANTVTEGNYYRTDDDFNQGVYCCYQKLKTGMSFYLGELAFRSDECELVAMTVSTQDRYDLDHFEEQPNNKLLSDVWNIWYNGIYRCNDVLDHMEGKTLANGDKYRGECLFLRSWWYFSLYRVFGTVPVTRTVVTPVQAKTIPRCTDEEMYNLLVGDLKEAIELLPVKRSAEVARVTKIAAQALLGKVYLTFGKYAEAQTVLEDAMKDTNYGLMPTTAAVFDVANKMNKEILFAIYYNKSNDNGHGYWHSTNVADPKLRPNPTEAFRSVYSVDDNRFTLINDYQEITPGKLYAINKYMDTYDATYKQQVGNDFPLLRYADVVLMYAEALGQQGSISDALAYLNKTRIRAGLPELTDAEVSGRDAFIKELADERGREFALEGQRWFDLVRMGLAVDLFKNLGYSLDSHNLLFPIPHDQIEIVNDSSILWQNPGF